MPNITPEITNLLSAQKLGYVATINPDNTPNLSPKGTIIAWEDGLAFADIKSPQTISNLKENPNVEINVVDPLTRRGFRFKGTAILLSKGEQYQKILLRYKEQGIKSKIRIIVLVKIDAIRPITSPLYDLGFNEEEIKKRWKQHYLSS